MMGLNVDDLDPEVLKKLGLKKGQKKTFYAEDERQFAIKVLNVISGLTQKERGRVLKRAITMNDA